MLESKGLKKVSISKTNVMMCARDVASKEAAVGPCSECRKRVGVNSMGNVWECKEVWQEWHTVLCAVCRGGGTQAVDEFRFDDDELECVGEFPYLGDMLNDAGGVEQAVAAEVRAAWMKFRELGGILCM